MGRKPIPLPDNAEAIVSMEAAAGGTDRDIAAYLGIGKTTLQSHFGAILTKQRAVRRLGLARKQTTLALKGNVTMLIWLGKQPAEKGGLAQVDRLELGPVPDFSKWSDADLEAFLAGKIKPKKPGG